MLDTLNPPIYGITTTAETAIVQWLESRFGVGFPALTQAQASSLIYLSASVAVHGWELAMDEFIERSALPPKQRSTQWRQMAIPIGLMQTMSQNGEEIATACIRIVSRFGARAETAEPVDCSIFAQLRGMDAAPKSMPSQISGGG
jgi:hypothetical protein